MCDAIKQTLHLQQHLVLPKRNCYLTQYQRYFANKNEVLRMKLLQKSIIMHVTLVWLNNFVLSNGNLY